VQLTPRLEKGRKSFLRGTRGKRGRRKKLILGGGGGGDYFQGERKDSPSTRKGGKEVSFSFDEKRRGSSSASGKEKAPFFAIIKSRRKGRERNSPLEGAKDFKQRKCTAARLGRDYPAKETTFPGESGFLEEGGGRNGTKFERKAKKKNGQLLGTKGKKRGCYQESPPHKKKNRFFLNKQTGGRRFFPRRRGTRSPQRKGGVCIQNKREKAAIPQEKG